MTLHATDPRSGFFRFLHHDKPIEYSANVDERIAYIRAEKPPAERAGRLAAILRIPDALIPVPVVEAQRASDEAWQAWRAFDEEARRAFMEAQTVVEAQRASDEAWQAWRAFDEEAHRASMEAYRAYAETQRAYEEAHRAYIVAQRAYVDAQRAAWADGGLALALSLAPLPEGVKWDSTNTCLELT